MKRTTLFKYSRKIHKWAGLFLGIQLVLWVAGGLVMSALPGDKVRGKHLVDIHSSAEHSSSAYRFAIADVLKQVRGDIKSVHFSSRLNQPAYKVVTAEENYWFDANSGVAFDLLTEQEIRTLAAKQYAGEGQLQSITLLEQLPMEMRNRKTTMWQVRFDDWMETTFYMAPDNGAIVRVRSDIWRFYDFFWMLHIMDYSDRSDSHNWLLIIFSFLALVFSLTGVVLWFQVFKKRDFYWQRRNAMLLQKR